MADHNYPKITIITPSYNQGQYIEQTILSVLNQNYPNLEYIIIDGGSTDNTVEIIKKYEHRLTYWVSEKDKGQSDAINKGLKIATGEVFNWINSDDWLEPGALHKVGELFRVQSVNVVVGFYTLVQDEKITKIEGDFPQCKTVEQGLTGYFTQPSTFFRMSCIRKTGELSTSLHYCMDLEMWYKYLFHFGLEGVLRISAVLANFRFHDNSKTVAHHIKFLHDELRIHFAIRSQYDAEFRKQHAEFIGNYQFSLPVTEFFPVHFLKRVFSSFFYKHVSGSMATKNYDRALLLLPYVDPACLNGEEYYYLNMINFELKYVPAFLRNFYRFVNTSSWVNKFFGKLMGSRFFYMKKAEQVPQNLRLAEVLS